MRIVETSVFTRRLKSLLNDDEYRALQNALVARPESGKIIKGSGGLRKLRWSVPGRGKRGGVRIIYYWNSEAEIIYLLMVFAKNEQENLTYSQLKILKNLVESELR